MRTEINPMKVYKTREPEMGFTKVRAGMWRFVSLQDGDKSVVGPYYASKAELLADANRYLESWGY